jgi:hypothetical protein
VSDFTLAEIKAVASQTDFRRYNNTTINTPIVTFGGSGALAKQNQRTRTHHWNLPETKHPSFHEAQKKLTH